VVDEYDRRLLRTYLDALVRESLLPPPEALAAPADSPAAQAQPPLELNRLVPGAAPAVAPLAAKATAAAGRARGRAEEDEEEEEDEAAAAAAAVFRPPPPLDYEAMRQYIEGLPADYPALYAMHGNAQLSLLNSQTEALFQTILEVGGVAGAPSGGGGGGNAAAAAGPSGGEASVRPSLADLLGRLPAPLNLVEIEARVKEKTPFVVVALQVGGRVGGSLLSTASPLAVVCLPRGLPCLVGPAAPTMLPSLLCVHTRCTVVLVGWGAAGGGAHERAAGGAAAQPGGAAAGAGRRAQHVARHGGAAGGAGGGASAAVLDGLHEQPHTGGPRPGDPVELEHLGGGAQH
jgi:hypothetical protein